MEKNILFEKIKKSRYTVAFTGAGISIPSGNPSFDTKIDEQNLDTVLNINFFINDTLHFYKIYRKLISWTESEPNIVHKKLKELNIPIITQNIDGLHTKAGSNMVIELHGNLSSLYCKNCSYEINSKEFFYNSYYDESICSHISCPICNSTLRPKLVFFGEPVENLYLALNEIYKADLLLVLGNSLRVWPANRIVEKAKNNNCEVIIINNSCEQLIN
jgi:NAD-dependent deacetylase